MEESCVPRIDKNKKKLLIIRTVFCMLLLGIEFDGIYTIGVGRFFRFFTQWGLTYNLLYFAFSIVYQSVSSINQNPKYIKLWNIMFEIGWTIEWLISVVFWLVLAPAMILNWKEMSKSRGVAVDANFIIYNCTVHILPAAGLLLDIIYNKAVFRMPDVLYSLLLILCYAFMDCLLTYFGYGEAYPIVLTWKNYITIITIVAFLGVDILAFFVGYKISQKKLRRLAN